MVRKTTKLRSSSNEKYKLIWKVGLIAALIIFSCWQLIPSIKFFYLSEEEQVEMDPGKFEKIRSKALNLGLDLQGGIHLVMQVDTSGMEADEANDSVDKAMTVIANRVDQFGLVEPVVQRQGSNRIIIELPGMKDVERAKRLIGQTARLEFKFLRSDEDIAFITEKIDLHLSGGAQDTTTVAEEDSTAVDLFGEQEQADDNLKKFTRFLSYQKIPGGIPSFDMLSEREDVPRMNAILADAEVMKIIEDARVMFLWGPENARSDGLRELFLLDAQSVMTGEMVRDAQVKMGSGMDAAKPEISFDTTSEGVREWARITGANIGKRLAIDLDNTIYSAPVLREKIYGGSSRISGNFSTEEARDLAIVLRAGALPATVDIIEDRTIGPSLGADSIKKSKTALIIGLAVVIVFMVFYYMGAGLITVLALFMNMLFILAYLAYFRATLTLPGMAGIVLTIGMAVDANVLIFERIREELRLGNTTRVAVSNGYQRARWTILDSNITTFLTAIILYNFGTGPIKGFALTLMVGIVASVFTALVMTKIVFDIITHKVNLSKRSIGYLAPFVNSKFRFIDFRKKGFVISGIIILVGLVSLAIHGGPKYSIDFLGGNLIELHFEKPVEIDDIREALGDVDIADMNLTTSEIKFIGKEKKDVLIRIVDVGNMSETSLKVKESLRNRLEDKIPADESLWILREEQVGPSIGIELKGQAFWAIMMSLLVLVIYITIRFEFKYSIGAILALVHDILITVGLFSILNKEISLTIIAALLTIVGYSLNDTIVVFDRIREKLRGGMKEGYLETLNTSVNETLGRTVITSFTTFLTVLSLFFFGGAVIHDFSFALLVGVVVGTYSSIFVATPLLAEWYVSTAKKLANKR
jgi:SecD/SecF fusion protein